PATVERVQQSDRTDRSGQFEAGVDLDHRQAPPGRGDLVGLPDVRLLPHTQSVDLGFEGRPVDYRRRGRIVDGFAMWGFVFHFGTPLISTTSLSAGPNMYRWSSTGAGSPDQFIFASWARLRRP